LIIGRVLVACQSQRLEMANKAFFVILNYYFLKIFFSKLSQTNSKISLGLVFIKSFFGHKNFIFPFSIKFQKYFSISKKL